MDNNIVKTLTIDGVEHNVEDLGPKVRQLVEIRSKWVSELVNSRLDVAKLEAAIRELDRELLTAATEALKPAEQTESKAASE